MGEALGHSEVTPASHQFETAELDALASKANQEARQELNNVLGQTNTDPGLDIDAARRQLAEVADSPMPDQASTKPSADAAIQSDSSEPESDPNRSAETRRIIALIDQRKEFFHQADIFRAKALQLALDHDLLGEFPALKPWEADGLKQGLVDKPAAPTAPAGPNEREAIMQQIQASLDESAANDLRGEALTPEIRRGV